MKTLIKIFVGLLLLVIVVLGVAYFIVTRPGVQQKFIEAQLPAGSTLEYVQITPLKLVLRGVDIQSPDGSRLQIGRMESGFSPLAALFDQTIRLSNLEVDSLVARVPPAPDAAGQPAAGDGAADDAAADSGGMKSQPPAPASDAANSPTDALYALGQLEWLLEIDSIDLQGAIIDAFENRYAFNIVAGKITPGAETELEASLELESKEALEGGLQNFTSQLRLQFTQKLTGGFESLALESSTAGSDASGASLLSASQTLTLQVDAAGESAQLTFAANVDLPEPGIFLPEFSSLRGLVLQADLTAQAQGTVVTLDRADFDLTANSQPIASVNLEQALTLGAEQQFVGRLMTVDLVHLPLNWVNPWLGDGIELAGAPVAAQFVLEGGRNGTLEVQTAQALVWGPFSLARDGQPLLEGLTLQVNPVVRVDSDQTVHYDIRDLQLADRYGSFIGGTLKGRKKAAAAEALFAGLQTKAQLEIGLAELLQQPVLEGTAGVLAGQAKLQLTIDETAEFPAQLQASVDGLRARSQPGSQQDFRLAAQLKRSKSDTFALGANLQAGLERRPSTSVQLAGQVQLERSPLPFKLDLTSTAILQRDLDILLAALTPQQSATAQDPRTPGAQPRTAAPSALDSASAAEVAARPPWADLDGSAQLRIDQLTLNSGQIIRAISAQADVSEALLAIEQIKATLPDGQVTGGARVAYQAGSETPYDVTSQLQFENVDPSVFSQQRSGSFPVRGLFDGEFQLNGGGETLPGALENSQAQLMVTGREGVLTAFELDNRSQLGLLGAGILGQQLNRPGITAMAQAVPYFKDMRFQNFTLNLSRGQDKVVRIPELTLLGDNVRIEGAGMIAASRFSEVLSQPLQLSLNMGARGRLIDYLETLQLLGPDTGADGFRNWKSAIDIGGTLGDPDTSALKKILNEAARRAISNRPATDSTAEDSDAGEQVPAQESKQERRRDEVDMGLDLLNSVFGN